MASGESSFAPNEFIKRWLIDVDMRLLPNDPNILCRDNNQSRVEEAIKNVSANIPTGCDIAKGLNCHDVAGRKPENEHTPKTCNTKKRYNSDQSNSNPTTCLASPIMPIYHYHTTTQSGSSQFQDARSGKQIQTSKSCSPGNLGGMWGTDGSLLRTLRQFKEREEQKEDLSRKYARRKRHRTKTDKYEYKGDEKAKNADMEKKKHDKSKRSRRKKSGLDLNEAFKAPNVQSERLTLKSQSRSGFLGKGKASSPVVKQGLPDLTFSEMSFLKKRSRDDYPSAQKAPNTKTITKKVKYAQEISQFFSKASEDGGGRQGSGNKRSQVRMHSDKPSVTTVMSSPRKLGSCRPPSLLAANLSSDLLQAGHANKRHKSCNDWIQDRGQPNLQHHQSEVAINKLFLQADVEADTNISCSIIPCHHGHQSRSILMREDHRTKADILDGQSTTEPHIPRRSYCNNSHPTLLPSSMSNKSVEDYTKYAVLGTEDKIWKGVPRCNGLAQNYSLEDLKDLARISNIADEEYDIGFSNQAGVPQLQRTKYQKHPYFSNDQQYHTTVVDCIQPISSGQLFDELHNHNQRTKSDSVNQVLNGNLEKLASTLEGFDSAILYSQNCSLKGGVLPFELEPHQAQWILHGPETTPNSCTSFGTGVSDNAPQNKWENPAPPVSHTGVGDRLPRLGSDRHLNLSQNRLEPFQARHHVAIHPAGDQFDSVNDCVVNEFHVENEQEYHVHRDSTSLDDNLRDILDTGHDDNDVERLLDLDLGTSIPQRQFHQTGQNSRSDVLVQASVHSTKPATHELPVNMNLAEISDTQMINRTRPFWLRTWQTEGCKIDEEETFVAFSRPHILY